MKNRDELDCECMNEEFDGGEELPRYHWVPVAIYNYDDTKIKDLTKQEQIEWIKKQKQNGR